MERKKGGLTCNQLKGIALIAMTCDHIGKQLCPQYILLQIVGRLAFPIFAFMIAEGCRYTSRRRQYLTSMAKMALLCQAVYFLAEGSLYQCILVTFSLSILLVYSADNAMRKKDVFSWFVFGVLLFWVWFLCVIFPGLLADLLPGTDFAVDYGVWGVLLPLLVYIGKTKAQRILLAALALLLLGSSMQGIQWYGLAAVPFLMFYNGERGGLNLKRFFYLYYPLHLLGIYLAGMVL